MRQIKIFNSQLVTLVDDDDYDDLSRHNWTVLKGRHGRFYAKAMIRNEAVHKRFLMHRFIMSVPDGLVCDHIDGDGLNNQKANLRIATSRENSRNRGPVLMNGERRRFKGVHWKKQDSRWQAKNGHEGKWYHLGLFKDPVEAARKYDEAALRLHGAFAWLNFPRDGR